MVQKTFADEVTARRFGDDLDTYGWSTALRLLDAGVLPLEDGDRTQLGLLRARIARSQRADWHQFGNPDRAVMRNHLAVAIEWPWINVFADASEEEIALIPNFDPSRIILRVYWNTSLVDEVTMFMFRGTYQAWGIAWGSGTAVSVWHHAAAGFLNRLHGHRGYNAAFEQYGAKIRKTLPR